LEGACNSAHKLKGGSLKRKLTLYNLTGKNPMAAWAEEKEG